jgi:hypothetical protein
MAGRLSRATRQCSDNAGICSVVCYNSADDRGIGIAIATDFDRAEQGFCKIMDGTAGIPDCERHSIWAENLMPATDGSRHFVRSAP